MNITYSEKPVEIEGLKKFLEARKRFENYIDKCIDDYFKDKPKIIRCLTYANNSNHWTVITEDWHVHDINIIYEQGKFKMEVTENTNFKKSRDKIITDLCKTLKCPRWIIEG